VNDNITRLGNIENKTISGCNSGSGYKKTASKEAVFFIFLMSRPE
jgi:hypothetical protein